MASASSDVGSDVGHSAPVLRIPAFPPEILLPNWRNNRADSSKLNTAAYSIRCTLASMCGMHVHRTGDKRKHDIWACCEEVYGRLLRAMQHRHGEAAVIKYLGHTSLTMVAKMTGEKIFRMSQNTGKTIVNRFNPKWRACLDSNGQPPSGKNWEWVRNRVLVMLYHESKGDNDTTLAANEGKNKCMAIKFFLMFFLCLQTWKLP